MPALVLAMPVAAHAGLIGYQFNAESDIGWSAHGFITFEEADLVPGVNVVSAVSSFRFLWQSPNPDTSEGDDCLDMFGLPIPDCTPIPEPPSFLTFDERGSAENPFDANLWADSIFVVDAELQPVEVVLCTEECHPLNGLPYLYLELDFWDASSGLEFDILGLQPNNNLSISWDAPVFEDEPESQPVPEPGTLALLFLGLVAIGALGRRAPRILLARLGALVEQLLSARTGAAPARL